MSFHESIILLFSSGIVEIVLLLSGDMLSVGTNWLGTDLMESLISLDKRHY